MLTRYYRVRMLGAVVFAGCLIALILWALDYFFVIRILPVRKRRAATVSGTPHSEKPGSNDSGDRVSDLVERECFALVRGEVYAIYPDEQLLGAQEVREELCSEFHGTLRAIVDCAPEGPIGSHVAAERFYIIEVDKNSREQLPNWSPVPGPYAFRGGELQYIVARELSAGNADESVPPKLLWRLYKGHTTVIIGDNDDSPQNADHPMSSRVSSHHFGLALNSGGLLYINDLNSQHGTVLTRKAPAKIVLPDGSVLPRRRDEPNVPRRRRAGETYES